MAANNIGPLLFPNIFIDKIFFNGEVSAGAREFLLSALIHVNLCLMEIIIQPELHYKHSISISSTLLLNDMTSKCA